MWLLWSILAKPARTTERPLTQDTPTKKVSVGRQKRADNMVDQEPQGQFETQQRVLEVIRRAGTDSLAHLR